MTVKALSTKAEFDRIISSGKVVFIDFWATWCGPCRLISPIFEKLSETAGDDAEFYKVDVDEESEISESLNIRAMPTFLAFKDGQKVGELVGANPKALQDLIAAQIKK